MGRLDQLEPIPTLRRSEYAERLGPLQRRLLHLRLTLGGQIGGGDLGPALLIVLEGPDAAGKGGAIKRLVEPLDPRHYRVTSFAAPTHHEKRHHFLWRFWRDIPGQGGMAVFDRSWYGRVLVERVEGYASLEQWSRAYDEIVQFERTLVLEDMILVKLWLQISDDEQLHRFEGRAEDPLKAWKLTDDDWRNREKLDDYRAAAEEMFGRTDHGLAPWDLIDAEQKRAGRIAVLETVIRRVEDTLRRGGVEVPDLDPG